LVIWRLSTRRRARDLDGAGNRDRGARWNSGGGRDVVYASLNVATCVLETFVHFGPKLRAQLPDNFMLIEIEVPDDAGILRIEREQVPTDAHRRRRDGRTWYLSGPAIDGSRVAKGWLSSPLPQSFRRSATPCSTPPTRG
jgi:RES domain-containing protein